MQIAIDARMILPKMTGVGRYLLGLAGALRELPDGPQVELWLQRDLPPEHPAWSLQNERLALHSLALRHMEARQYWELPGEVRRRRPDVLHYPHFDLPWGIPGPVVVTIHDLKYLSHPEFFPQLSAAKRLAMRLLMLHAVRRAQQIIAVSEFTRQDIARRLHISPKKITAIPHGVDASYLAPVSPEAISAMRQRYHLEAPFLLFVGERRPHKNIPGLLEAFACFKRLASPTDDHQLVIVGKSYADYQEPERRARLLGLERSVRFLDYVPDADLPLLYHAADAFALLSYYEGFGLPIIEAMACGAPVIVANLTSLPEVCGEAGLLVEADEPEQAAQALLSVIPGGGRRAQYLVRGQQHASQFTWENCARATANIYRACLAL